MTLDSSTSENATLSIENLTVGFNSGRGCIRVVDGVSLSVPAGKIVALVGESGCGKSVTALSVLRLLAQPPAAIEGGPIRFRAGTGSEAIDILQLDEQLLRSIRGRQIGMVFQEPMSALNPVMTVGRQIVEAIRVHRRVSPAVAKREAVEALDRVGIREPQRHFAAHPHQLSGGMRQRALLAMALINDPALLIADEPTTALDATIQMHLLELLKDLQVKRGLSVLIITHDLGVVAEVADHVYVMYAGQIVEQAPVAALFDCPLHPYTQGLMRCTPRLDVPARRLPVIPGTVPSFAELPTGCRFHPRCERCMREAQSRTRACLAIGPQSNDTRLKRCVQEYDGEQSGEPKLREFTGGHFAACWEIEEPVSAYELKKG